MFLLSCSVAVLQNVAGNSSSRNSDAIDVCRLGRTELHNAVCRGDETCVQQLLQNRAAVDAKDGSGPNLWTAKSCKVFPDKSILTILIQFESLECSIVFPCKSAWCIFVSSSQVFSSFRVHPEAGHHSTWPAMLPVRSESNSSSCCWRPGPRLMPQTSAAWSLSL